MNHHTSQPHPSESWYPPAPPYGYPPYWNAPVPPMVGSAYDGNHHHHHPHQYPNHHHHHHQQQQYHHQQQQQYHQHHQRQQHQQLPVIHYADAYHQSPPQVTSSSSIRNEQSTEHNSDSKAPKEASSHHPPSSSSSSFCTSRRDSVGGLPRPQPYNTNQTPRVWYYNGPPISALVPRRNHATQFVPTSSSTSSRLSIDRRSSYGSIPSSFPTPCVVQESSTSSTPGSQEEDDEAENNRILPPSMSSFSAERKETITRNDEDETTTNEHAKPTTHDGNTSCRTIDPVCEQLNHRYEDSENSEKADASLLLQLKEATPIAPKVTSSYIVASATHNEPTKALITTYKNNDTPSSSHATRLALPNDKLKLNALHCFIRSEMLEIFVVQPPNLSTNPDKNGEQPIPRHNPSSAIGRVGLRCVHCGLRRMLENNNSPPDDEAPMAVFYPKRVSEIYRLVTSWQRCHVRKCQSLPPDVRKTWQSLRDTEKSRGKTAYWVEAAQEIGLVDCISRAGGIRFRDPSQPPPETLPMIMMPTGSLTISQPPPLQTRDNNIPITTTSMQSL